ncbi:MAG: hypothetical protein ABI442_04950 [Gemmatimonadaceae bacterium]
MRARLSLAFLASALSLSTAATAQLPVQTAFVACPTSVVYLESQVQTPARLISDSTRSPHLVSAASSAANTVQFVVDTLGVPDLRTVKTLRVSDSALVRRVIEIIPRWRYSPAVASGCKVPQRVTASVIW